VDFTFWYRLTVAERSVIGIEAPVLTLYTATGQPDVVLTSTDMKTPLKTAKEIALRSAGWSTEKEADVKGAWYAARLDLALVRHRVGVRPEQCVSRSMLAKSGLQMGEAQPDQRVLNDTYGLSVFPSDPPPRFARIGGAFLSQPNPERIVATFSHLCSRELTLTSRDHLAIDLFNTSFLQPSSATRVVTLVMAVESLLEQLPRPPETLTLVDSFIKQAEGDEALVNSHRDSFLGSLRRLRLESIGSAGRRLAMARLGKRKYMNLAAPKFFDHCYCLRSKLVHGTAKQPSDQKVKSTAGAMEVFVAEMITQPFLGLEAAEQAHVPDGAEANVERCW